VARPPDRVPRVARVVVIGGGFGGLAAAARLAKLGHAVTLVESAPDLGGALRPVTRDGFSWDASASMTLLPAVVRDLFRKSGRPAEREIGLEPLEVIREHRFEDGTSVRLPGGSRAAQLAAFDELGAGLGQAWVDHVAAYADDWEVLRKHYLEVPWTPDALPRDLADRLRSREHLARRLKRSFKDQRLRLVAGHPFTAAGHHLREIPAWAGLEAYVEQRFGGWRVTGGLGELAVALTRRMEQRKVDVLTGVTARDVVVREGRAAAVSTDSGEIAADLVVCAVDPRRLPALKRYVERTNPAYPPLVFHLGLEGDLPDVSHELVLHGDPTLVVRPTGTAPDGRAAWTVHAHGKLLEDVLLALARHRIDLREHVVTRIDLTPADLVRTWNGSPLGVRWQGRGTVHRRLGPSTPVPGVYAAGAHATPGAGLPYVGLSAALVAQVVGPATP